MDQEKVKSVLAGELAAQINVCFLVVEAFLLIGNDFNGSALTGGPQVALKRFLEGLVGCSDYFVHGKLH